MTESETVRLFALEQAVKDLKAEKMGGGTVWVLALLWVVFGAPMMIALFPEDRRDAAGVTYICHQQSPQWWWDRQPPLLDCVRRDHVVRRESR